MKIIVGITGASGAIYAQRLLEKLSGLESEENVVIIFSDKAKQVWRHELGNEDFLKIKFPVFKPDDFFAPPASGSARFETMIVCPCSMGSLARIANGISDELITRSADVMLKEKRRLILVIRESPLNLIHIRNMKLLATAGAIILPASPSFYSKPSTITEIIDTVIDRTLILAGYDLPSFRWGEK
jgi:4-hydroxy-3-polyprenylbenzoate decarboxylase